MRLDDDTIAAIATPMGQGGIGIVRLSGADALAIADRIFLPSKAPNPSSMKTYSLAHGSVVDPADGRAIDEVLLSVMRSPHSYTREDVVEINCHGGMVSLRRILELLLRQGARHADPGEFTKRAFLNGRINLTQAEAVLDIIQAKTGESMRIAAGQLRGSLSEKLLKIREHLVAAAAQAEAFIDFPEEDIGEMTTEKLGGQLAAVGSEISRLAASFEEARFFRDGLSVAIAGRPNVGKSSLLNALLQKDKAIVTHIPGTTRDLIEDSLNIKGLPVRIMDTAGLRTADEIIEQEGIRRTLAAIEEADCIIAVLDGSEPLHEEDRLLLGTIRDKKALIVINKADLPERIEAEQVRQGDGKVLRISARSGEGIDTLKEAIFTLNLRNWGEERDGVVVTNIRHKAALDRAALAIGKAGALLSGRRPLELFSIEMREALDRIGEITGEITTDEILGTIFSRFCIGK